MSATVLITGGLGYLGGRISQYLEQRGDLQLRVAVSRERERAPQWLKRGELVTLDLLDHASCEAACRGVRQVVHLAAVNEIESAEDPARALLVNGVGTVQLLRAAERAGVERFIYFSTAHVYGAPLAGTITEETLPRPVHPYAITHRSAEDFVLAAHAQRKLAGIVLRLSNGFGAPEAAEVNRWTLLVNDLCRQAVATGKLVLRSSGLQRRDFITLEDVARATGHFLDLPADACGDGLFNLGGDSPLQIIELVERIVRRCSAVLGFTPEVVRPAPAPGETAPPLDFRIDRLRKSGFELTGDVDREIDATLLLCRDAFGSAS